MAALVSASRGAAFFSGFFSGPGTAGAHREATDSSSITASRRAAFLAAATAAASWQDPVRALGPTQMPLRNVKYEEVTCDQDSGEMLKGTFASKGLYPRCVEFTARLDNPKDEKLKRASVFGRINDKVAETSVLANAQDGASDVGQTAVIDVIPPGDNVQVKFRIVAALPKADRNKPLPVLAFKGLKAEWYGNDKRWEPIGACDLNPSLDECN